MLQAEQSKRVMRLPEVINRTGLSRSSIYLRLRQGSFPEKINLGGRAVGWLDSEIDNWIQERISSDD